jgi:hypothetical protein
VNEQKVTDSSLLLSAVLLYCLWCTGEARSAGEADIYFAMKSFWAISCVIVELKISVLETDCHHLQGQTEPVFKFVIYWGFLHSRYLE